MLADFDYRYVNSIARSSLYKIMSAALASSVFLSGFNINILAFYYACCSLIACSTHYLFCDVRVLGK